VEDALHRNDLTGATGRDSGTDSGTDPGSAPAVV